MEYQNIIVFITAPSEKVARQVGDALLERRLAACVNLVTDLQSFYWWQGEIESDEEVLMIVKTRADLFESRLIPAVQEVHPYDVPEIIALPIVMGSRDYLAWVDENVQA